MKTNTEKLLVTTPELQIMLACGRHTAIKIGTEAGARIQLGRAVRWRVSDIKAYLQDKKEVTKS